MMNITAVTGLVHDEMTTEQIAEKHKRQKRAFERLRAQKDGRADAFGMILRERLDDTGRKIREWDSATGRKGWMEPFKQHITHEMVRINNRQTDPAENQEFLAQWSEVHKRG
jgi:hypothetical protein